MKILVVEDDFALGQALNFLFASCNYAVDIAAEGGAALDLAKAYEYDSVVLDIGLPDLNGVDVCKKLRHQGFHKPILLLTGQNGCRQKAVGLNAGADDYVVKPFDPEELVARVQALLRRKDTALALTLTWGKLCLDPNRQEVNYGTRLLSLTPKEYLIIELLLQHNQKPLNACTIVDRVWNSLETPGEETVRVHIKDLRQKLKAAGAPGDLIQTIYRRGYRLNPIHINPSNQINSVQTAQMPSVNEQLRAALEELRLTRSRLQQKNEELEIARQIVACQSKELQKTREKIELQVMERTAELAAANEELRDMAAENLQLALNAMQAGSAEVNLTTGICAWSDRLFQILGYAPSEVEPSLAAWRARVHPDDLKRIEKELAATPDPSADCEYEYRVVRPNGKVQWVLARQHDFLSESGALKRRLWIVLEIGDRQNPEPSYKLANHRSWLSSKAS